MTADYDPNADTTPPGGSFFSIQYNNNGQFGGFGSTNGTSTYDVFNDTNFVFDVNQGALFTSLWTNSLNDYGGDPRIGVLDGWLIDSGNGTSIDWLNRWQVDSGYRISHNWESRVLNNSSEQIMMDYDNGYLYAFDDYISINFGNRTLTDAGGNVSFNWDLLSFPNIPTSPSGLASGQIWCDTTGGHNYLKKV